MKKIFHQLFIDHRTLAICFCWLCHWFYIQTIYD